MAYAPNGSSTTLLFTYDGWKPTMEWDGAGNLAAWNIYGAGADEILWRYTVAHGHLRYHHDRHGNVTFLLGPGGEGLERYTYDAFGKPKIMDWAENERTESAVGNRFMFEGREWIPELAIYDYRHRMYQPELGRFLQSDPLGLQTEGEKLSAGQKALFSPGGSVPEAFSSSEMNLFRYCGDDPVDNSDPLGLVNLSYTPDTIALADKLSWENSYNPKQFFTISGEGLKDGTGIERLNGSTVPLARILQDMEKKGYDGKQTVLLIVCNSAAGRNPLGAQLAKALHDKYHTRPMVQAPTTELGPKKDGMGKPPVLSPPRDPTTGRYDFSRKDEAQVISFRDKEEKRGK